MSFILNLPSEIQAELGQRLRVHRLAQALSQEALASMAGLSLGAVRKLERDGQCSLATFIRAAQTLGLTQALDPLFDMPHQPVSIAQAERAEQASKRQRAPSKRFKPAGQRVSRVGGQS